MPGSLENVNTETMIISLFEEVSSNAAQPW